MIARFGARGVAVTAALALVSFGCADDDAGGDDPTSDAEATTDAGDDPAEPADAVHDARDAPSSTADVDAEPSTWSVAVDVEGEFADGTRFDAGPALTFDPLVGADPFAESASCSGLRQTVAAYSVWVSGVDDLPFVGIWTADSVTGPGTYDAEMTVERGAARVDATGTLTLGDDLQSGTFVGFGPDDGRIEGDFECSGVESPDVLALGDPADGTLESIEVFALLRTGGSTRVVGLSTAGPVLVSCPAVDDDVPNGVLVSADGGESLGSIRTFELTETSLRMAVGGAVYDFDGVVVTGDGASGSFGATNDDGTSVDGAYRCT